MSLDEDLGRALGRKEPPPEFATRVLARIAAAPIRKTRRAQLLVAALGLAASFVIGIAGVRFYNHRQALREAERVTREVEIALRITGDKLNVVQLKMVELSARRGVNHDDRTR